MTAAVDAGAGVTVPLGDEVRRGVRWKLASQIITQAVRFGVALLIARALTPADYGIAAEALIFIPLGLIFSDIALGAALVQRPTLEERHRSTVFWATTGVGLGLTVLGVATASLVAGFFDEPEVAPLFAVLSTTFLLSSLGATHAALMSRDLQFRSLELRRMGAAVVGGLAAVIALALDWGVWAIVTQAVAAAIAGTVLLWVFSSWRPRLLLDLAAVREMASFSLNVTGSRVLFYTVRNVDNILVGRVLGTAALGAYALAYNVMLTPLQRVTSPLQDVLYPALARLQSDPKRLGAAWIRATRVTAVITVPTMLGLVVVAPDFVPVVLGEQWEAAIPVLQILSLVGLHQSLQRMNSSLLQAADRSATLLRFSALSVFANVIGFVVGLPWGIVGVATAYAITSLAIAPAYLVLTARVVGIPVSRFLGSLAGVMTAGVVMAAGVFVVRVGLTELGVGQTARLFVCVAVGCAIFAPMLWWRDRETVMDLRRLVHGRRSARAA